MPLYDLGAQSVWEGVRMCLFSTATGDMIFMGVIYLCIASAERSWRWPRFHAAYRHPAVWVIPIVVGVLLATSYELWAVYAQARWSYGASMPLIPIVKVGLAPVLQMVVVPLAVIALCWWRLSASLCSSAK